MDIVPGLGLARFSIIAKDGFKFLKQIGAGAKMAEVTIALRLFLSHHLVHLTAIVTVEGVPFDKGRLDVFTPQNLFKRPFDRSRASSGRPCNRNDRMFG
jgi:hypothetical protein